MVSPTGPDECPLVERTSALHDGALDDPGQAGEARQHLPACPSCTDFERFLARLDGAIAHELEAPASPAVWQHIGPSLPARRRPPVWRAVRSNLELAPVAALALFVCVLALCGPRPHVSPHAFSVWQTYSIEDPGDL